MSGKVWKGLERTDGMYYINIQDVTLYALADLLGRTGRRTMRWTDIVAYAQATLERMSRDGHEVMLLDTRADFQRMMDECFDILEFRHIGAPDATVTVRDSMSPSGLLERLVGRLPLLALRAMTDDEVTQVLKQIA